VIIIGVDEAGRGPLAGGVLAAAVILPVEFELPGLTDSKKLSAKKRETLYQQITQSCEWAVGEASCAEIDQINILQATLLAMRRAILNLQSSHAEKTIVTDYEVLVDGNRCPDVDNCRAIIKGDLTEPAISAASIIAKVTRDRQMMKLDTLYPQYGFAKHKGYGTKVHMGALTEYGPIVGVHRYSFAPVRRASR
jgi:ribonuclease HII